MSIKVIKTDQAPAAIGPYSQGIVAKGLLYTAMQIPLDPKTGEMVGRTIDVQTRQCLENIKAVVEGAGGSMSTMVKVMIYLSDISHFAEVNDIYGEYFTDQPPARGVIETTALPKGALVAIEAIASVE